MLIYWEKRQEKRASLGGKNEFTFTYVDWSGDTAYMWSELSVKVEEVLTQSDRTVWDYPEEFP